MKKIIAIVSVAIVLVSTLLLPVGAESIQGDWSDFNWVPYYPYVDNEMSFTPTEGRDEYYSADNVYYLWGTWTFQNAVNGINIPIPIAVPSTETEFNFLFTQTEYGTDNAVALVYSVGSVYVANGGLALRIRRLANEPSLGEVIGVYAYDYTRDAIMTLYDENNGWVNNSYRNLSFGTEPTKQIISPQAHRILIQSGLLQPLVINYGPSVEKVDFTAWLVTAVSGFMNFTIFGGFTFGDMFGAIVAFSFVMVFLKFFAGG